jgi:hypothetical protein
MEKGLGCRPSSLKKYKYKNKVMIPKKYKYE